MKEGNPCIDSGCLGNCCKNISLELTTYERNKIFPDAIKVNSLEDLDNVPKDYPDVYYTRIRRNKFTTYGMYKTLIVGRCPHLLYSGNCDIHEERSHAARNLEIGSELCNEIRKHYLLPNILPKDNLK